MNNQIEPAIEAPAPKQTPKRRGPNKPKRKVAAAPQPPSPGGEFAGLTAYNCPNGCTAARCVITTISLCGHPFKANLHNAGPKTKAKIIQAKKFLKHQMVDAEKL